MSDGFESAHSIRFSMSDFLVSFFKWCLYLFSDKMDKQVLTSVSTGEKSGRYAVGIFKDGMYWKLKRKCTFTLKNKCGLLTNINTCNIDLHKICKVLKASTYMYL